MSRLTDQEYLLSEQYGNADNLNARIALHRRFSTNKRGWNPWAFDQLDLSAHGEILDVGCGPCDLWVDNVDRIPDGWHIVLSDLSSGMLGQARDNLRDCGRVFTYWCADAQAIPFADERFDIVIANHMLYHVPDRARAISEMHRVLKPGGRLYTATNGHAHLRELREWIARFDPQAQELDAAMEFGLDRGGKEQLARHFAEVEIRRYPDGLVVTEVAPFVAYALSTSHADAIRASLQRFVRLAEDEIASAGAIRITKDVGLFVATKEGCT
jgi:ubiquinone/menaquinone biosynthesis C-methylase UbiE